MSEPISRARQWLLQGGGGHEDGEAGIRAMTLSGEALVEDLEAYDEYLQKQFDAALQSIRTELSELQGIDQACDAANEHVMLLQRDLDAATELMAPSPCGVEGHVMLNWVEGHFFEAMKPCNEPYDVYKCEICRKQMHDHRDGLPSVWLFRSYCRTCKEIEAAYQRGASDGIESVARGRTNNE